MTFTEHKIMSWILVGITLSIGASIIWSQPEEWLLSSLFFALLSLGLWRGLKVKRDTLVREIKIQDDACETKAEQYPKKNA
jgi:hypothetical protein